MGFQVAIELAKWFVFSCIILGVGAGFFLLGREAWREWREEKRNRVHTVKMPLFIVNPKRTKEQERGRFCALVQERSPNIGHEDMLRAIAKFEEVYDDVMARNFRADLESISPEDFGGER